MNFKVVVKPLPYLEKLMLDGYVFHGSTRKIETNLIPHLTNDTSKEFGNQKGVYLTSNPLVAMFRAFVGGIDIGSRKDSKRTEITTQGKFIYSDVSFAVEKPEAIKEKGYIYIFPKEVVDDSYGLEHISFSEIMPDHAITVFLKDFPYVIKKMDNIF